MARVLVFTYNASKEDLEIVDRWMKSLDTGYTIFPIPQYNPKDHIVEKSKVVTFGATANNLVNQCIEESRFCSVTIVKCPKPSLLTKTADNLKTRKETLDKLNKLKADLQSEKFLPTQIEIKEGDLPDLDRLHLAILQKISQDLGENGFFQVNKNGKLIEISNKPSKGMHMHITFEELYTVRQIMDVLKTEVVTIVKPPEKEEGNDETN